MVLCLLLTKTKREQISNFTSEEIIMLQRTHMQDQIHNRIEELMNEKSIYDWDDIFQNAITFSLVILFMSLGLSW